MSIWQRITLIPRQWVYSLVWLAVIIPLIVPVSFKISITPEAKSLYEAVEALPGFLDVMLTFDLWPNALAETEPMARAALHHLVPQKLQVVTVTTIPFGGPSLAERVTREMAEQYGKSLRRGFRESRLQANYVSVLKGMGSSIEMIYPTDNSGTPLSELAADAEGQEVTTISRSSLSSPTTGSLILGFDRQRSVRQEDRCRSDIGDGAQAIFAMWDRSALPACSAE